jgi:glycosyltransferase involved in cell wall biosynthesis
MRICVISTTAIPCPPTGYSGLEQLAWQQAVGLSKNHKVTLIAPTGSQVPDGIRLIETVLRENEKQAYSKYWKELLQFDCIIDHSWQKWSTMLKIEEKLNCPLLLWLHAPINTMFGSPPPINKPSFVCISQDQSNHVKELLKCDSRVCYNGIDTKDYRPINKPKNNNYLFLARFSSIKGPDIALNIAKKCKIGLDMIGDDTITGEPELAHLIKTECNLTPRLRYIGPQTREQCVLWFNTNKALLHPNLRYREPVGLAPVEAQACGMPVIAWNYGAMSETILNNETGFLVNSQEEIEELIKTDAVSQIKPKNCTNWAQKFSYESMINRVEEICFEAIETGGW